MINFSVETVISTIEQTVREAKGAVKVLRGQRWQPSSTMSLMR